MSSLDDLFDTKPKKPTPPEVNREGDLVDMILDSEGVMIALFYSNPESYLDANINKKYLSEGGKFFIDILDNLLKKGVTDITNVNVLSEARALGVTDKLEEFGGVRLLEDFKKITRVENADAIVNEWVKWNMVKAYYQKGLLDINKFDWNKLVKMNASNLYDYIEHQLNSIDLDVASDFEIERLSYSDEEIQGLLDGENMGYDYSKHCYILNSLTLGIPRGDITLFAGYSGSGKSSFVTEAMIITLVEQGIKCCIISNEMKSDAFKLLLEVHVLTQRLDYWKVTRRKLKSGNLNDEELKMVKRARDIIVKEYNPYLVFVKLFDYNVKKVGKIVKKLSRQNFSVYLFDTLKADTNSNDASIWQGLLNDSKELFQIASKNNVAMILTMQLSLATKNKQRWLDESALSNSKQVIEVCSNCFTTRNLWNDEFAGETYDIKPYKLKKNEVTGKYEKEYFELDKDKVYKLIFMNKTRADKNGDVIIYQFIGEWNIWKELGYATVSHKNNY